ncbi:MFS transporter [Mycobacterium spongiae]|uniref:MFS transporter n=1 Tax=Mycobacterium spongiae TaxID=886343 RepID=UPI001BAD2F02|nr:MFS transporter [Mycobacterium spongiae]
MCAAKMPLKVDFRSRTSDGSESVERAKPPAHADVLIDRGSTGNTSNRTVLAESRRIVNAEHATVMISDFEAPTDRSFGPAQAVGGLNTSMLAGYPAVLWLLLGGSLVLRLAGFAYPFLVFLVAGLGYKAAAFGIVSATFGLGWAIGLLVCGSLVDRFGARMALVSTMLLAAGALAMLAQARSLLALVIGALVVGLVHDAPRPVLGAAIAELVAEPLRRVKIDTWRYGLTNAAMAIAGGVGGVLAGWFGAPILYWINAIACAGLAVVALFIPAAGRGIASVGQAGYRYGFSDKRLVLLFFSSLATLIAFMGLFTTMPMLISESSLGVGTYGWALLGNAVTVVALTPLIGPWVSRRIEVVPRVDILAAAAVWVGICMAAVVFTESRVGFGVAAIACAPAEIAWFGVSAGVVHRIAPAGQAGRYHGIWSAARALAAVIAPLLGSAGLMYGGRPAIAATTAIIVVIGSGLCLPLAHSLAQPSGGAVPTPIGVDMQPP